jgi:hypothetical protein
MAVHHSATDLADELVALSAHGDGDRALRKQTVQNPIDQNGMLLNKRQGD